MNKPFSFPLKQTLKVIRFRTCSKEDKASFIRMGILPGTTIQLLRKAPLGDPFEVCVKNTCFALSKATLQKLEIAAV